MKYDFGGIATKYNVVCTDGLRLGTGAFKHNDGRIVPLVWNHDHNRPQAVCGHALLEDRGDDVYAYCSFNNTESGKDARELVRHGDICALSIFANHLQKNGNVVMHGEIREVSLVLAGANPGAMIDCVSISHSEDPDDFDAVITHSVEYDESGRSIDEIAYSDEEKETPVKDAPKNEAKPIDRSAEAKSKKEEKTMEDEERDDRTVQDVLNEMDDEQLAVVDYLVEEARKSVQHSDEEDDTMRQNVFDQNGAEDAKFVMSKEEFGALMHTAEGMGSLRQAVDSYIENGLIDGDALEHSITNIGYFYPDAKTVTPEPTFINRDQEWVSTVLGGVHHSPFAKTKSWHANLTADQARAKGYVKGNQKVEEVIVALKRSTEPQTIYKLQKLDRDDVIDITDFNIVAWIRREMRIMLNEEIARAILIGDGRTALDTDKIKEDRIRPIWTDDSTYVIRKTVEVAATDTPEMVAKKVMETIIRAREEYKGSGSLTQFTTEGFLADCRLIKNGIGDYVYKNVGEINSFIGVSKSVGVPVMNNQTRTAEGVTYTLKTILVNLIDYTVGTDKGGEITLFDDFDLNFNKYEYLIETRMSGAMTTPYGAIVVETVPAAGDGE